MGEDQRVMELLPFVFSGASIFLDHVTTEFGPQVSRVAESYVVAAHGWAGRFGAENWLEYRTLVAYLLAFGAGYGLYKIYQLRGNPNNLYKLYLYGVGSFEALAALKNSLVILANR